MLPQILATVGLGIAMDRRSGVGRELERRPQRSGLPTHYRRVGFNTHGPEPMVRPPGAVVHGQQWSVLTAPHPE
jgi:hypothetical protein